MRKTNCVGCRSCFAIMASLISDVWGWVQGKGRLGPEPDWFQKGEAYLEWKECFLYRMLWIWGGTTPALNTGHEWLQWSFVMPSQKWWVPWKCTQATGGISPSSTGKDQEDSGSQILPCSREWCFSWWYHLLSEHSGLNIQWICPYLLGTRFSIARLTLRSFTEFFGAPTVEGSQWDSEQINRKVLEELWRDGEIRSPSTLFPRCHAEQQLSSGAIGDSRCRSCCSGSGVCLNSWTLSKAHSNTTNPFCSLETVNWGCFS